MSHIIIVYTEKPVSTGILSIFYIFFSQMKEVTLMFLLLNWNTESMCVVNHFLTPFSNLCSEWGAKVSFLPKGRLPVCLPPY